MDAVIFEDLVLRGADSTSDVNSECAMIGTNDRDYELQMGLLTLFSLRGTGKAAPSEAFCSTWPRGTPPLHLDGSVRSLSRQ